MNVGERLREGRKKRNLSLRALGELTGFSASFLSQVELGQASPSLGSLQRIAEALELSVASLLAQEVNSSSVLRQAGRGALRSDWSKATVESLVQAEADERLQAMLVRLDPGGRTGALANASGRRLFAYCTAGAATVCLTHPTEQLVVEVGDSLVVDGPRTTAWENSGASVAEVIVVTARLT